jgi:hypothetical protein
VLQYASGIIDVDQFRYYYDNSVNRLIAKETYKKNSSYQIDNMWDPVVPEGCCSKFRVQVTFAAPVYIYNVLLGVPSNFRQQNQLPGGFAVFDVEGGTNLGSYMPASNLPLTQGPYGARLAPVDPRTSFYIEFYHGYLAQLTINFLKFYGLPANA